MDHLAFLFEKYCSGRFNSTSIKDIRAFERHIGVNLPKDYKDFILIYNGGYFRGPKIAVSKEFGDDDRLSLLLGITPEDDSTNLLDFLNILDDNDPTTLLPIGMSVGGKMLIMQLTNGKSGTVLIKRAESNDCCVIADSFSSFIENRLLSYTSK